MSSTTNGEPTPEAQAAFRQLCHMLSLSRTGKVQSAIDNLVLTVLSVDPAVGKGGDPNEVATAVSTYFGVTLDVGDIRAAFETHLRAGRIQIDRTKEPNWIVLSPAVGANLAARIAGSTKLEEDVFGEWLEVVASLARHSAYLALFVVNWFGSLFWRLECAVVGSGSVSRS